MKRKIQLVLLALFVMKAAMVYGQEKTVGHGTAAEKAFGAAREAVLEKFASLGYGGEVLVYTEAKVGDLFVFGVLFPPGLDGGPVLLGVAGDPPSIIKVKAFSIPVRREGEHSYDRVKEADSSFFDGLPKRPPIKHTVSFSTPEALYSAFAAALAEDDYDLFLQTISSADRDSYPDEESMARWKKEMEGRTFQKYEALPLSSERWFPAVGDGWSAEPRRIPMNECEKLEIGRIILERNGRKAGKALVIKYADGWRFLVD